MMQIFVLLMMVALLVHDQAAADLGLAPAFGGPGMLGAVLGSYAAVGLVSVLACGWTLRVMSRQPGRGSQAVDRLESFLAASRGILLGMFLMQLYAFGWLVWLRESLGNLVLLNEVLTLAPPLLAVGVSWWAYYPIDRRLREASLIRQLDRGDPIWPIWTRWQYLLSQVRHQLLLMMLPLLAMLTWVQIVERVLPANEPWEGYRSAITLAGGLGIFLTAPLMIRHVWDTIPLPAGDLRERLMAMCGRYGVRVRELLLWRTYGGVVNGAVMGLIGRLRYIMLTDGLIERLEDDEVEAVMAHELGHVRCYHMPWMAICAITVLLAWGTLLEYAWRGVEQMSWMQSVMAMPNYDVVSQGGLLVMMVLGWFLAFGYISRRFERQADTFAAQHFSRQFAEQRGETPQRICAEGADVMCRALHRVAELSQAPPNKSSWRHGSIAWRVAYLRSLAGRPLDGCSIDAQVHRLRVACIVMGVAAFAVTFI